MLVYQRNVYKRMDRTTSTLQNEETEDSSTKLNVNDLEFDENQESKQKFNMFVTFENVMDDGYIFHPILNAIDPSSNTYETEVKELCMYFKRSISHYGSNVAISKYRNNLFGTICLLENKLPFYNAFLQLRGFRWLSTYLHVYWNHLEETLDYIGLATNEMVHKQRLDDLFPEQQPENRNPMYIVFSETGYDWNEEPNLLFFLTSYNSRLKQNISSMIL